MKALITGGGGFLGKAIGRRLVERGDEVKSFSRGAYPELAAEGIDHVRGDLGDGDALAAAARGVDAVFHVAALAGIRCDYEVYRRANVVGTENVVAVCRELGIPKLVYTSTPSVVFRPGDGAGIDESLPYPTEFYGAHYARSKAIAERAVLAANGPDLATVALRPRLIWGPGDNHLAPRLIARAKAGRLKRIGDGANVIDHTYIGDAVEAHVLAHDRLEPGSAVAGNAYFISQGEPVNCWELVDRILATAGAGPVAGRVPKRVAYAAGWLMEKVYGGLGLAGEPPATRFMVLQLSESRWFDLTAARRDLGYAPKVSVDEGLSRLKEWLATRA